MKRNILLSLGLLLLSFTALYPVLEAQNKTQDSPAASSKEQSVGQSLATLRQLDADIATSEKEIQTVQEQLEFLQDTINVLEEDIKVQQNDLTLLREEYLKSVKKMRVARKRNSGLVFIFASKSLGEAKRRLRYMREFSAWRTRRNKEITGKINLLHDQRQQLVQAYEDVAVASQKEENALHLLAMQREEQQETVKELRDNSETLKSKLAQRQEENQALGNRISQLLADLGVDESADSEMVEVAAETVTVNSESGAGGQPNREEYAIARNRDPRSGSSTSGESVTQSETIVAVEPGFGGMKGNLPVPVNGSFKIVSAFGVHPVSPDLPNIMEENLGIDAHVAIGAAVNAVYDGEVIKVYDHTSTPGFRNIVIVKHGDYITVYANIESLAVKAGQKVKQGQKLGTAGTDFDNPKYGMLHFEVWKNRTRLDPASWIRI